MKPLPTEIFIKEWFINNNGTIATYMNETPFEDEDLVKGREALSETLGLWMEYALLKEDKKLFDESYNVLNRYFLTSDGFVHWKLTEFGKSEVSTNALIDDLRIILALVRASEMWRNPAYIKTAKKISKYVSKYNNLDGVFTDFYERKDTYANEVITLTYIDLDALQQMEKQNFIDEKTVQTMDDILHHMPNEGAFFPKGYNVTKEKYIYDKEVNLIDQALVALTRARRGYSTTMFNKFIRQQLQEHNVIYGKFDLFTKMPIVDYESPAIYGWLIIYFLEMEENDIAEILFKKMQRLQNGSRKYEGGYSIYDNNTHVYDNLVPLLAEMKLFHLD